jgi:hypothetical protein
MKEAFAIAAVFEAVTLRAHRGGRGQPWQPRQGPVLVILVQSSALSMRCHDSFSEFFPNKMGMRPQCWQVLGERVGCSPGVVCVQQGPPNPPGRQGYCEGQQDFSESKRSHLVFV